MTASRSNATLEQCSHQECMTDAGHSIPCIYEPISPERLAEIKRQAEADARAILKPVRKLFRELYGR